MRVNSKFALEATLILLHVIVFFLIIIPTVSYNLPEKCYGYFRCRRYLRTNYFGVIIDTSDSQWRDFRSNLPLFMGLVIMTLLSRIIFSSNKLYSKHVMLFMSILAIIIQHGYQSIMIFIISLFGYNLSQWTYTFPSYISYIIPWVYGVFILFLKESYQLIPHNSHISSQSPLSTILHFIFHSTYSGLYSWRFPTNFLVLRMISYAIDKTSYYHTNIRHDAKKKKEEDIDDCSVKKNSNHTTTNTNTTTTTNNDDISSQSPRVLSIHLWNTIYHSFYYYFLYIIYLPLYIGGPIITYDDFIIDIQSDTNNRYNTQNNKNDRNNSNHNDNNNNNSSSSSGNEEKDKSIIKNDIINITQTTLFKTDLNENNSKQNTYNDDSFKNNTSTTTINQQINHMTTTSLSQVQNTFLTRMIRKKTISAIETRHLSFTEVIWYSVRWGILVLGFEYLTHMLPIFAIVNAGLFPHLSLEEMFVTGFLVLKMMWLKFLILWRFFRLWSMMDGIFPHENMKKCMCNNYSLEQFWKGWHHTFHLWIVKYMYVPLGGRSYRLLSVWCIFFFVSLWHDLDYKLFLWGGLNAFFYGIEVIAKRWNQSPFMLSLSHNIQHWIQCLSGAVYIFVLIFVNLIGYALGTNNWTLIWDKIYTYHGIRIICISLYFLCWGVKGMFFLEKIGWSKPL